jgi:ATP-dependent DNA helicase RecQ
MPSPPNAAGEVSLNEVVRLQQQQLDAIRFAIEQFDGGKRLKPVFDALEGEFSYEVLRCVRSDMAR